MAKVQQIPQKESNQQEVTLQRLAHLLLLEKRLRDCETEVELGYLVANDTLSLVSAATALLWRTEDATHFKSGSIHSLSSSPLPDKRSPFSSWSSKYCRALYDAYKDTACIVRDSDLPEKVVLNKEKHVAEHAIWLPLNYRKLKLGALILWRTKPWTEAELRILTQWAGTITHAWHALRWVQHTKVTKFFTKFRTRVLLAIFAMIVAVMFYRVPLSVLAPAELVSSEFTVIRSPLQGVIDELHVESNTPVEMGDPLISLDDAALRTELEVAQQDLAIAVSEFAQAQNSARIDPEARARLPVLEKSVEKYDTQVLYLSELLSRTEITAPEHAIAIVEDSDEMIGRPVQLGERLITLVDADQVELELWLPVGDDIELQLGSEVNFFPNVAPEEVYLGYLRSMDYQAQDSPLGVFSYKVKATVNIPSDVFIRIGMRGTAKLYGNEVSLFYYLFRRPISYIRQTIGF